MKLPILLSATALTISALALVSALSMKAGSERMEPPAPNGTANAHLRAEVAAVNDKLDRLSARLDAMADQPAALVPVLDRLPAGDLVDQGDLERLRLEVLAMLERMGDERRSDAKEPGRLQQDVATALEEVRRAERESAREAKSAKAVAALEERMSGYQQKLGLTASETDGLRTVLADRQARWDEMGRLWEAGDREAVGAMKEQEREIFDTELSGVLNEQQVEQFRSMNGRRGGK